MTPVSREFELSVNREIIENNQEMAIEKQERVTAANVPEQKYLKVEKSRRSKFLTMKKNQDYKTGGWFMKGLIELKGGGNSGSSHGNFFLSQYLTENYSQ